MNLLCYIFIDIEKGGKKGVPEAKPSHTNMHISSHKIRHPQFFPTNYPWEDTMDENITLHWLAELFEFILGKKIGVAVLKNPV
jgi:hypothetical protein